MDRQRLEQLLDAYGADPARWPAAERADAEALLEQEPALRARLVEARSLDGMLEALPTPEPSAQLRRAVAEIPVREPREPGLRALWPFASLWRPLSVGVAMGSLGVVLGWVSPQQSQPVTAGAALQAEGEWDELTAVAFADSLVDALDEEPAP